MWWMLGGDHLLGGAGVLAAAEAFDLGDAARGHDDAAPARLVSSSTAQIRLRALVSPGKRPMTLVRRRTSTKVRSSRLVTGMKGGRCRPCRGTVSAAVERPGW